jgi:uncharacterized protein (DUF433 family)
LYLAAASGVNPGRGFVIPRIGETGYNGDPEAAGATMTGTIVLDSRPINKEPTGAWRVGNSRVLVEIVIRAFDDGATPEAICMSYPSVSLPEVYDLIAYYLRHREEIQAYLHERDRTADELRAKWEVEHGAKFAGLKEKLLARRAGRG